MPGTHWVTQSTGSSSVRDRGTVSGSPGLGWGRGWRGRGAATSWRSCSSTPSPSYTRFRTICAQGAVQSSSRSRSRSFNSIYTRPNDWHILKHIPNILLIIMTLPFSRIVCWNLAFLHHKLKTSVHADAEAIVVEDVNRWMKTLLLNILFYFFNKHFLGFSIHSNQSIILTQQSLVSYFSHFHSDSDIIQAVSRCQTWPWQRYAPYSTTLSSCVTKDSSFHRLCN